MDQQYSELLKDLSESIARASQHANEQAGWTAEITVLLVGVMVVAVCFIGWWLLKTTQKHMEENRKDLRELQQWRQETMATQLQATTQALDGVATSSSQFGVTVGLNTAAIEKNTHAVVALSEAIMNAPCGEILKRMNEGGKGTPG